MRHPDNDSYRPDPSDFIPYIPNKKDTKINELEQAKSIRDLVILALVVLLVIQMFKSSSAENAAWDKGYSEGYDAGYYDGWNDCEYDQG